MILDIFTQQNLCLLEHALTQKKNPRNLYNDEMPVLSNLYLHHAMQNDIPTVLYLYIFYVFTYQMSVCEKMKLQRKGKLRIYG